MKKLDKFKTILELVFILVNLAESPWILPAFLVAGMLFLLMKDDNSDGNG